MKRYRTRCTVIFVFALLNLVVGIPTKGDDAEWPLRFRYTVGVVKNFVKPPGRQSKNRGSAAMSNFRFPVWARRTKEGYEVYFRLNEAEPVGELADHQQEELEDAYKSLSQDSCRFQLQMVGKELKVTSAQREDVDISLRNGVVELANYLVIREKLLNLRTLSGYSLKGILRDEKNTTLAESTDYTSMGDRLVIRYHSAAGQGQEVVFLGLRGGALQYLRANVLIADTRPRQEGADKSNRDSRQKATSKAMDRLWDIFKNGKVDLLNYEEELIKSDGLGKDISAIDFLMIEERLVSETANNGGKEQTRHRATDGLTSAPQIPVWLRHALRDRKYLRLPAVIDGVRGIDLAVLGHAGGLSNRRPEEGALSPREKFLLEVVKGERQVTPATKAEKLHAKQASPEHSRFLQVATAARLLGYLQCISTIPQIAELGDMIHISEDARHWNWLPSVHALTMMGEKGVPRLKMIIRDEPDGRMFDSAVWALVCMQVASADASKADFDSPTNLLRSLKLEPDNVNGNRVWRAYQRGFGVRSMVDVPDAMFYQRLKKPGKVGLGRLLDGTKVDRQNSAEDMETFTK